jgi:hypothetical protein
MLGTQKVYPPLLSVQVAKIEIIVTCGCLHGARFCREPAAGGVVSPSEGVGKITLSPQESDRATGWRIP